MFGRKKPPETAAPGEDADEADVVVAVEEESPVELKTAELAPKSARGGGLLGLAIGAVAITAVAAGGGILLGLKTADTIERTIALRDAGKPAEGHVASLKFSGEMVLQPVEAVITNLATPADTWIRLEAAMVFRNGDIENPAVTAAEVRQDVLAYLRTLDIGQLEGPSALQHLRDDLNERVSLRTDGKVSELVIQTLVVQ